MVWWLPRPLLTRAQLGDGVSEDAAAAAQWLARAADAPDASAQAQTAYAMLLLYEQHCPERARPYLAVAARRGDPDAARELERLAQAAERRPAAPAAEEARDEPRRVRFWWDRTYELNERRKKTAGGE